MSSIWTPGGEHRLSDDEPGRAPAAASPSSAPPAHASASASAGDFDDGPSGPPVSAEELEAIREVQAQIRATPAIDIVANHAVQLFELSLVYMGVASPPDAQGRMPSADLVQAGVAIDAMATLVDGLGARFSEHEQTLRDALSQIQMLYVQVADSSPTT
ncbi:MAG TPA: hypothetical protein VGI86_14470 [Acidimicrobiia bacterium]|jgi:hypothetical protein